MERKEKILRKINLKDYTNRLEKVLEKKDFSLQLKNLLLSMFYKIENAYLDYEKTKVEVCEKGEFLERIIKIIEEQCNEIVSFKQEETFVQNQREEENNFIRKEDSFIKEKSQNDFSQAQNRQENAVQFNKNSVLNNNLEESNIQEIKAKTNEGEIVVRAKIDKEQGKIIALANELVLLESILEMSKKAICIPDEESLMQKPLTYFLNLGSRMHEEEVIRDFNGWSWDNNIKDIPNIELNLVFQNLIYLLGHEFMINWIQNESKLADYLILAYDRLKQDFGEKKAKSLMELFCKLAIEIIAKQDEEQKEIWKKLKKQNNQELSKLEDKKTYLEEITKQKKLLTKQIENIDKMLNNGELLQKEYEQRNEKLPNKEKIFSLRHLVNKIEIERQEYIDKIKQCNVLIDPKGYVARKEEIKNKQEFLDLLDLEEKEDKRQSLANLCNLFLSCFQIKIAKAQTKQEITDYFYSLRYYYFLPFDRDGLRLKELEILQESFEHTIELLIEKAYKLNMLDVVTDDSIVNYKIIRNLFDSKMIDLNHTVIETKVEDGKLLAEYYDTNILESRCEIQSEKTVKLKKKVKLFV